MLCRHTKLSGLARTAEEADCQRASGQDQLRVLGTLAGSNGNPQRSVWIETEPSWRHRDSAGPAHDLVKRLVAGIGASQRQR